MVLLALLLGCKLQPDISALYWDGDLEVEDGYAEIEATFEQVSADCYIGSVTVDEGDDNEPIGDIALSLDDGRLHGGLDLGTNRAREELDLSLPRGVDPIVEVYGALGGAGYDIELDGIWNSGFPNVNSQVATCVGRLGMGSGGGSDSGWSRDSGDSGDPAWDGSFKLLAQARAGGEWSRPPERTDFSDPEQVKESSEAFYFADPSFEQGGWSWGSEGHTAVIALSSLADVPASDGEYVVRFLGEGSLDQRRPAVAGASYTILADAYALRDDAELDILTGPSDDRTARVGQGLEHRAWTTLTVTSLGIEQDPTSEDLAWMRLSMSGDGVLVDNIRVTGPAPVTEGKLRDELLDPDAKNYPTQGEYYLDSDEYSPTSSTEFQEQPCGLAPFSGGRSMEVTYDLDRRAIPVFFQPFEPVLGGSYRLKGAFAFGAETEDAPDYLHTVTIKIYGNSYSLFELELGEWIEFDLEIPVLDAPTFLEEGDPRLGITILLGTQLDEDILEESPRQTVCFDGLELSGPAQRGCGCAAGPVSGGSWWVVLLAGLGALGRRRSRPTPLGHSRS